MSSKAKHEMRSHKTYGKVMFKSTDMAYHKINRFGMMFYNPKRPKPSRFIEDRPNAKELLAAIGK